MNKAFLHKLSRNAGVCERVMLQFLQLFPLFDLLFIHTAAFTPLGFICLFGPLGSVNFLVFDLGSPSVVHAAVPLPEEEHR